MPDQLTLKYIPLAQAQRWDRNPKRHDIGAICRSIELHGFRDPPAYDAALDAFVEGNGRTDALEALWQQKREPPRGIAVLEDGGWALPVLFGVDARSRLAAEAYGIDHNNLTLSGGDFDAREMARLWDEDVYTKLLADLADADVMPVSVDGDDLDALLGISKQGDGGDDFDATPEDGPTRTQAGELWIIGGVHRLIVGDSTDPATVARLMGDDEIAALVTDPPYNVGFAYEGEYKGQDNKTPDEYGAWLNVVIREAERRARAGAPMFVWQAQPNVLHFSTWFAGRDWRLFAACKNFIQARPTWLQYAWDPVVCWTNGENKTKNHAGVRDWHVAITSNTSPTPDRAISGEHPCPRPLDTVQYVIESHTDTGDVVYEPFMGSGTTLIAAHRTGRRCYGIEIEPKYADVILRRAEAEGLTCERAEVQ